MTYDPLAVTYYTVAEVAQLLRISKMTVTRAVHTKELGAIIVGRTIRIPEPALRAWLGQTP